MIVRISKGSFPSVRLDDVRRRIAESEHALCAAITAMPGLLHYYAGIDEQALQVTNVSVWDTLEHAQAMSSLQPMLAQRPLLEAVDVDFEMITNHETVWVITP